MNSILDYLLENEDFKEDLIKFIYSFWNDFMNHYLANDKANYQYWKKDLEAMLINELEQEEEIKELFQIDKEFFKEVINECFNDYWPRLKELISNFDNQQEGDLSNV